MRKRIKFSKLGNLKFIGHLDLLRMFQRALKRADIKLSFSQGFNPHPLMSFAHPLSLGITSEGEYLDMTLQVNVDNEDLINRLNDTLPDNVRILEAADLEDKEPKAMAAVRAAKYVIQHTIDCDIDEFKDRIAGFIGQDEILIEKINKKKRKVKMVDIKPGILNIVILDKKQMRVLLSAGSVNNIKPQLLMKAMYDYMNEEHDEYEIKYHREDLYRMVDNNLVPLI